MLRTKAGRALRRRRARRRWPDLSPRLIIVGADKGGVGKTFVARTLMEFLPGARAVDTEATKGLSRFYPTATVLDADKIDDQMRLFDAMPPLTLVDMGAGQLLRSLRSMRELGLLEDTKAGRLDLTVVQPLGPNSQSADELVEVAAQLDAANHYTLRNMVSPDSQFFAFNEVMFAAMDVRSLGTLPHLDDRAAEAIDSRHQTFHAFEADDGNSFTLRRRLTFWLAAAKSILGPVLAR